MGIFTGLFRSRDKPKNYYHSPSYAYWFGRSKSGAEVNPFTAMQQSAVYACIKVLAESVAQLPLHLYERTEHGKEPAVQHPLYKVLHDQPNPEMTSYTFREVQHNFSVFREGDAMAKGLEQLKVIRERLKNARLDDTSSEFNTQRVECLELDNLMETAYATAVSANFRTESRGAHSRFDFPDRDDENWLCHSLYLPESESMTRRSVNMEPKLRPAFPPKIRTY